MSPNETRPFEPRPFKARYRSECADGWPVHAIEPGDIVIKLEHAALFDMSAGWQRKTGKMYREVKYSHEACWKKAQAEATERKAKREQK